MASTSARNVCPVCRTTLAATPFVPIAERQCPRCEAWLWALALPSGPKFFVRRPGQSAAEFLAVVAGPALGASARDIGSFLRGANLHEVVEFLNELEAAAAPGCPRAT